MKIFKVIVIVLLCIAVLFCCCFTDVPCVEASSPYYSIVFSNIGNTHGEVPTLYRYFTTYGVVVNGYPMVALYDLEALGATITIDSTDSTIWRISLNGQQIIFTESSTYYTSSISYDVYDGSTGQTTHFSKLFNGNTDVAACVINGERYIQLSDIANQCGALMVRYDSVNNQTIVHHYRVNTASNAYADDNTYLVGGPWLSNWSTYQTASIAPHFTVAEFADNSTQSSNPTYYSHLKISVRQLQIAENIRHNFNADSSMSITSGFRSWYENESVGGWAKSFHTRGRAFDTSNTNNKYDAVRLSFQAGTGTDYEIDDIYYYNQGYGTAYDLTGGTEIEIMPQSSGTWLHIQSAPSYLIHSQM